MFFLIRHNYLFIFIVGSKCSYRLSRYIDLSFNFNILLFLQKSFINYFIKNQPNIPHLHKIYKCDIQGYDKVLKQIQKSDNFHFFQKSPNLLSDLFFTLLMTYVRKSIFVKESIQILIMVCCQSLVYCKFF